MQVFESLEKHVQGLPGAGLLLAVCCCLFSGKAAASGILNLGPVQGSVTVTSWKERRDAQIVKQQYDFSCGASSLATLLTFFHDIPVTEVEILAMLDVGDMAASFADLKKVAESHFGLEAVGLASDFDTLTQLTLPAIVYLKVNGRDHFSVIRGINETGNVWLADPSSGNRIHSRRSFLKMWQTRDDEVKRGKLLVVLPTTGFNRDFFVRTGLFERMRRY